MKTKILSILFLLFTGSLLAQGTAFTYQGRLNDGGSPAHGSYDFRFKLFEDPLGNNQAGSTILTNGFEITNGLFIATLDFGGLFNGSNYWIEVDVRTNGGSFENLNPLQPVLPTPYAMFANTASNLSGTISSANLSGTYGGPVDFNNSGNNFGGSFSGNGASITNVNAATLSGLSAANFWKTSGNVGTSAGTNFVGTIDNQPLELRVNNQRALRLTPDGSTNNSPDVIGGSPVNVVGAGIVGATIGGGGAIFYGGQPGTNSALGDFNTIAGGWGNTAGSTNFDVSEATIAGGAQNTASGISSFIGGGAFNLAYNNNAVVSGGLQNRASFHATVAGGDANLADGIEATIGGGRLNAVQTNTTMGVIAGGWENSIQGSNYESGAVIAGGGLNTIQSTTNFDGANPFGSGYASSYSSISGGFLNQIQFNSAYSVIAGGKQSAIFANSPNGTIGGGLGNEIQSGSPNSSIGGGMNNGISPGAGGASIGGGIANIIGGNAANSTIGGGADNIIQFNATNSTIAGGIGNDAVGIYSTIGGGIQNTAGGLASFVGGGGFDGFSFVGNQANGASAAVVGGIGNLAPSVGAFVGGGYENVASNAYTVVGGGVANIARGLYSTVPGGYQNIAAGDYSFAAGYFARANHSGSFVWADVTTLTPYSSDRNNQFKIRAGGGVQIDCSGSSGLNPPAFYVSSTSANGVGAYINTTSSDAVFVVNNAGTGDIMKGFNGGGSPVFEVVHDGTVYSKGLALTSDRNAKENFKNISSQQVLEKVASMSISQWNYKADSQDTRHVGPTAQDFHAAFGLNGADDKHISVVDEGGVALAAIQGLNEKLQQKDAEIQQLQQSVSELKQLVSQLAKQNVREDKLR